MDSKTKETEKQLREQAAKAKDPRIKAAIETKIAQLETNQEIKK